MLVLASAAQAQTVGLKHLYTVPGVANDISGTVIACTNGATVAGTLAVDVYNGAGTFVTGSSITASPNKTVLFATDNIPNVPWDVNLNVGILTKGHARVFGSGKGVVCTAYLVLSSNGQPITDLTVAAKFKQKGD